MKTQTKRAARRYADVVIVIVVSVGVAAILSASAGASMAEDVAAELGCALIVGVGIMIALRATSPHQAAEEFPAHEDSTCEESTSEFSACEPPTHKPSAKPESCGTKASSKMRRGVLIGCCLISAVLFASISALSEPAAISEVPAAGLRSLAAFAIVCLATGCSEEGLFRFLLPRVFEKGFIANGRDARSAAQAATLLSTLLFAFLHVGVETLPTSPLEGASMVLKFVQAVLFGLAMASLVRTPKSLVAAIIVHACYDLFVFAPSVWSQGWFPSSYLTDDPLGIAALAAASAALVPAVIAGRRLRKKMDI